jgi:hypothetical protein
MSCSDTFLLVNFLIVNIISKGVVCLAGKAIGRSWLISRSIVWECLLSFMKLCQCVVESFLLDNNMYLLV